MKSAVSFICMMLLVFFITNLVFVKQSLAVGYNKKQNCQSIDSIDSNTSFAQSENNKANRFSSKESGSILQTTANDNDSIKYAAIIISAISILLTIFLAGIVHLVFGRNKDIMLKIDTFNKVKEKAEKEIAVQLQLIKEQHYQITDIETSLGKNKTYFSESIESLFDCLIVNADKKKDKETLALLFKFRALSNIYSPEKTDRFVGISKLTAYGDKNDINHLLNLISLLDENEQDLKNFAEIAIRKITNRTKNKYQQA